jgi:hydroxymethylpyrimidine pyrophosphatase-like HAD family hydrolase
MHRASRLLASDLDGTLIAASPGPDDLSGVAAFRAAIEARALPTAYITGRHFALALEGVAAAGLPRPDMLACDVGTRIFTDDGHGGWRPDEAFHEEMRRRLGGVVLDDVHALLAPHAFLRKQPQDQQSDLKLSYEVPQGRDGHVEDARGSCARRSTRRGCGFKSSTAWTRSPDMD